MPLITVKEYYDIRDKAQWSGYVKYWEIGPTYELCVMQDGSMLQFFEAHYRVLIHPADWTHNVITLRWWREESAAKRAEFCRGFVSVKESACN